MTEHIDPLRAIRARLAEVTEPMGLELREMDIRVAQHQNGDVVIALFTIDADQIGRTQEQIETDAAVAEMERQMLEQTREDKAEEARANLDVLFHRYRKKED
jgi:hypothetical protein